jgi:hypothetical protein
MAAFNSVAVKPTKSAENTTPPAKIPTATLEMMYRTREMIDRM